MIAKLLKFELKYYTKQYAFYIALGFLILISISMGRQSLGGNAINLNSPFYVIFKSVQLSVIMTIFVVTAFSVQSILRDSENNFESIIFTTAIDKISYLISRFGGLVITSSFVMAICVVSMFISHLLPGVDPNRLGDFQLTPYIWVILVFMIPNALFVSSLIFATALFSKKTVVTYVCGVLIYVFYIAASILGNSPLIANVSPLSTDAMVFSTFIDPFGFIALFDQFNHFTVNQKNNLMPTLSGHLLYNRLIWATLSMTIFAYSFKKFKFSLYKK